MERFCLGPQIFYGKDSISALESLDIKKALIVTDEFMVKLGVIDRLIEELDKKSCEYKIFSKVEPNPSIKTVVSGLSKMIEYTPDTIIALGGGSPIDAAKAMIYFGLKIQESFVGKDQVKKPRFIAIPTTSGTGSEVTTYSVISDEKTGTKIALSEDIMLPDIAILDSIFTKTLPKSVIADTGMDVMTHAIESFVSLKENAFTSSYAIDAIKNTFKYLLKKYEDVSVDEYREKMQLASCMAGIAFSNSSLGINHSIAHAIGAMFHIPHGKANAILLPFIIKYNSRLSQGSDNYAGKRYAMISKELGFPSKDTNQGVLSLIAGIKILKRQMNIATNLKELGIDKDEYYSSIEEIINRVQKDICTTYNPTRFERFEYIRILQDIYDGE